MLAEAIVMPGDAHNPAIRRQVKILPSERENPQANTNMSISGIATKNTGLRPIFSLVGGAMTVPIVKPRDRSISLHRPLRDGCAV